MSMFREHWIGGLVAYSAFFIISLIATVAVPILYETMPQDWNPTIPPVSDFLQIIGCFVIAVLFGLWPDVDIKSKSQKIFYSVLFTLLPIMSKHRGWTHAKITMILLPCVFLLIPIYTSYAEWRSGDNLVSDLYALRDWDALLDALLSGLPFYVASFIGYASHLHLDGILFRSRRAQRQKARANQ